MPTSPRKPSSRTAAHAPAAEKARGLRHRAVADVRRASVLAAARSAFFELGLEGASLREIAKRAGYTPGALYSYFASKEEVYAALLGESLERLHAHVEQATPDSNVDGAVHNAFDKSVAARHRPAHAAVRAKATAFFDFYRENPRDLDLGFYLFQGMQPRGLTPALNQRLNARLRDALAPTREALVALGQSADEAQTEITALFAHIAGLLLLSHTGRIRTFGQNSQALFARYLDQLLARVAAAARTRSRA